MASQQSFPPIYPTWQKGGESSGHPFTLILAHAHTYTHAAYILRRNKLICGWGHRNVPLVTPLARAQTK